MEALYEYPHDAMGFVDVSAEASARIGYVYLGHEAGINKDDFFYLLTPWQARELANQLCIAADAAEPPEDE